MSWHHQLHHLPYRILFHITSICTLPKRLLEWQNKIPLCVAGHFGQSHCCPWRVKVNKSGSIQTPEQKDPVDGVSVDNIVSSQPGLIPQMSFFLTKQRLWGATTFLDHISDFVYVHLMQDLSLAETMLAKEAMKKVMAHSGRSVKHYHADNGRFAENGFVEAVNSKSQNLTFCGIGVHHQNGMIENKNKILTTWSWTLHSQWKM